MTLEQRIEVLENEMQKMKEAIHVEIAPSNIDKGVVNKLKTNS
ncbi:MAG: hypothetical protein E7J62_05185 [Serratia marcescens]|nr:hypothetical protein [Serratia marcescens]MDU7804022.1 hypothetical protein [Serratia marcescens]BEO29109.1 hypothetical protein SMQC21_26890 [Serratia marcescens]